MDSLSIELDFPGTRFSNIVIYSSNMVFIAVVEVREIITSNNYIHN